MLRMNERIECTHMVLIKDGNISFNGYIDTWILWIYRRYIDEYFYMNINISKINKSTLKLMKILSKNIKMTLIIDDAFFKQN